MFSCFITLPSPRPYDSRRSANVCTTRTAPSPLRLRDAAPPCPLKAFLSQRVGETVLRSALPRIRRLLHRQSRMTLVGKAQLAASAIRACASLLVAALRLSTSHTGIPILNPLLEKPTSVDFLGAKKKVRRNRSNGGSEEEKEEEDLDVTLPPKDVAGDWVGVRLRAILEEGKNGDVLLVEAAAWATLRMLQTVAMGPLRKSMAPRVSEAFVRVLLAGQVWFVMLIWTVNNVV